MRKLHLVLAASAALLLVSSVSVRAEGNSYVTSRPKWNGAVKVVDATTGAILEGAYVIGQNIPTGSYSFGLQVVNRDDGRIYDKSDAMGRARAMVRPFGTLLAWRPGYWPVKYQAMIPTTETGLPQPAADGVVTIPLTPAATPEDRKNAALKAAEWLEPEKRAPFVRIGRRANRSADFRTEARAAFVAEGVVHE
jgi:hypothetical protein